MITFTSVIENCMPTLNGNTADAGAALPEHVPKQRLLRAHAAGRQRQQRCGALAALRASTASHQRRRDPEGLPGTSTWPRPGSTSPAAAATPPG